MALMKIVKAPNAVLSKRAKEIDLVDQEVRKLMDDMLETMYNEEGIGLAANQVAVLKRVIVLDLQNDDEQQRDEDFYPLCMANPVITSIGEEKVEAKEACLSVPGVPVSVIRPEEISVEYLDYNNKKQTLRTGGWLARAIQHEIDHIDGKILIDYLSPLKKNVAIRKLKKYKKNAA